MAFLLSHITFVFSSFSIILGEILQKTAAATAFDHLVTDGGQFVKRIVHGEKLSDNPGYLLFTAPYKLCEGDCKDVENNFAMVFPIYVGKKGKEKYKELYAKDYEKIHSAKPNAPFKQRPTKKLFTPCLSEETKEPTTVTTTETLTDTTTTMPLTETTTLSEAELTSTDTPAEVIETETPTLASETESITILSIDTPAVFEISTTSNWETASLVLTSTEATTAKETALPTSEITDETTMYQTETPAFSDADVGETEDITFETESDTVDLMSLERETTFVTNPNGVPCPPRICKKKKKATPKIITLVKHEDEKEKLDVRNAQWDSDYSDLIDSFYFK